MLKEVSVFVVVDSLATLLSEQAAKRKRPAR
jgi:hypothetical protein